MTDLFFLDQACMKNDLVNIRWLLLVKGVDPNCTAAYSPLQTLCHRNNTAGLAIVLAHPNVYINSRRHCGYTALHVACRYGNAACVRLLLDHGANVNTTDICNETALMDACRSNSADCAALLLSHGAHVNYMDQDGRTSLTLCCTHASFACARLVLQHGAAVCDRHIFDLLYQHENFELTNLMLEYGANHTAWWEEYKKAEYKKAKRNVSSSTRLAQAATNSLNLTFHYKKYCFRNSVMQRQRQQWSRQQQTTFPQRTSCILLSILLCATRFSVVLPPEVWENCIFSFFQRKDFNMVLT